MVAHIAQETDLPPTACQEDAQNDEGTIHQWVIGGTVRHIHLSSSFNHGLSTDGWEQRDCDQLLPYQVLRSFNSCAPHPEGLQRRALHTSHAIAPTTNSPRPKSTIIVILFLRLVLTIQTRSAC